MTEKRQQHREAMGCALKVRDLNRDVPLGCLVDLSESGFMLLSDQAFDAGSVIQVCFELPAPVAGEWSIELGAESLWVSPANKPDYFWNGFRIIDVSASAAEILAHIVRSAAAAS